MLQVGPGSVVTAEEVASRSVPRFEHGGVVPQIGGVRDRSPGRRLLFSHPDRLAICASIGLTGRGMSTISRRSSGPDSAAMAQRGKPAGVGPTDHASSEDADLHGVPVPLLLTRRVDLSPRPDVVAARPP